MGLIAVFAESLRVVLVLVNGRAVLVLVNIGVSHTGGKSESGCAHEARGGDLLQIGREHSPLRFVALCGSVR